MTALKILQGVRELLSDEKRWTRGSYARDRLGRTTHSTSESAVCWCLIGALGKITNHERGARSAERALERVARRRGREFPAEWQDADGRTHAEVLALLDEAIAREAA